VFTFERVTCVMLSKLNGGDNSYLRKYELSPPFRYWSYIYIYTGLSLRTDDDIHTYIQSCPNTENVNKLAGIIIQCTLAHVAHGYTIHCNGQA